MERYDSSSFDFWRHIKTWVYQRNSVDSRKLFNRVKKHVLYFITWRNVVGSLEKLDMHIRSIFYWCDDFLCSVKYSIFPKSMIFITFKVLSRNIVFFCIKKVDLRVKWFIVLLFDIITKQVFFLCINWYDIVSCYLPKTAKSST